MTALPMPHTFLHYILYATHIYWCGVCIQSHRTVSDMRSEPCIHSPVCTHTRTHPPTHLHMERTRQNGADLSLHINRLCSLHDGSAATVMHWLGALVGGPLLVIAVPISQYRVCCLGSCVVCVCAACRAERAQRLGRNGSDQPASPPRADPSPPSAKGGPFRREDGEIVGESPSTSKRHAEAGRQQAGR